jgi:VanZ family protein
VTRRLFVVAFWVLAAFTISEALVPTHRSLHVFRWDKLEHAFAFGMLTLVSIFAFPRVSPLRLGLALSALGAAIEVLQPFTGRDGDIRDWIADTIAIAIVLALISVGRRVAGTR